MRLSKALLFGLMITAIIIGANAVVFAEEKEEEITLSTYYPAPYGEYDSLNANVMQIVPHDGRPSVPTQDGMMYFDSGVTTLENYGFWVYYDSDWHKLAGGTELPWITVAVAQLKTADVWNDYYRTYWTPNHPQWPASNQIKTWTITSNPVNAATTHPTPGTNDAWVELDTSKGGLRTGRYKITWGGGKYHFITGSKVYLALTKYAGVILDSYELTNGENGEYAHDGIKDNFDNEVDIPERWVIVNLNRNTVNYFGTLVRWALSSDVDEDVECDAGWPTGAPYAFTVGGNATAREQRWKAVNIGWTAGYIDYDATDSNGKRFSMTIEAESS